MVIAMDSVSLLKNKFNIKDTILNIITYTIYCIDTPGAFKRMQIMTANTTRT